MPSQPRSRERKGFSLLIRLDSNDEGEPSGDEVDVISLFLQVMRARKAGGWCPDQRWCTWQRKRVAVEGEGG
ncbi:hypothetical protein ES332_A10G254700v1 [Gossypium tomentosum]|uniref:Uncharacterized protein n=1 Tax=Gossypium tomentosum TaxID=34277 RepID=A0A5D2NXN5_GOSTO|nr:hypothetical protein ES332_A10G254700v1 [Gossypium tomentosum]